MGRRTPGSRRVSPSSPRLQCSEGVSVSAGHRCRPLSPGAHSQKEGSDRWGDAISRNAPGALPRWAVALPPQLGSASVRLGPFRCLPGPRFPRLGCPTGYYVGQRTKQRAPGRTSVSRPTGGTCALRTRPALRSCVTPGLSLPPRDLVCPVRRFHLRSLSSVSLSPRLSLIISSDLLPASSRAVCLFSCAFRLSRSAVPVPGTLLSLLPTPPALGSPSVTGCVRAPVSPPRGGPHTPPTSWRCRGRRLREGTGWGRRHPPPDVAGALGWGAGQLPGHPLPPPLAPACRVPGRMGCTVSLVCCEALEPGPPSSPQPAGSPPAPARAQCWEPGASAHAESRRLLLQVGRCGDGCGERVAAKPSSPE